MLVYPVKVETCEEMSGFIDKIGADPRSLEYFALKTNTLKIYAHGVDFRAAAFLKQEMLARGGDVVVHRNVIDGRVKECDVMIIGNTGELRALLLKMRAMDFWGLKELREELQRVSEAAQIRTWEYPLPGGRNLRLGGRSLIMGILNLTPDSFYPASRVPDGGLLPRAEKMLADGADILDIGAESTRPGSAPVSAEEERSRVVPALRALRASFPRAVISVDTVKPETAIEAADEGADIINDVGDDPAMGGAALRTGLPLVVTHCGDYWKEQSDKNARQAADVPGGVMADLRGRLEALREYGVRSLITDPGIGFGKYGGENMKLLKSIESFRAFGLPVLVGHSRKRFLNMERDGKGIAPEPEDRLPGTLAVSAFLASSRVEIIRVHDVRENALAVKTAEAIGGWA